MNSKMKEVACEFSYKWFSKSSRVEQEHHNNYDISRKTDVITSYPVRVVDFTCPVVNNEIEINGDLCFGLLYFWPVCQDLGVSAIA